MKHILVLLILLSSFQLYSQVGSNQNTLKLESNSINSIELNNGIELNQLYRIDDLNELKGKLGVVLNSEFQDHKVFQSWLLKYDEFIIKFTNKDGYWAIQSLTLLPTEIGGVVFNGNILTSNTNPKSLFQVANIEENERIEDASYAVKVFDSSSGDLWSDTKVTLEVFNEKLKSVLISFN